MKGQPVEERLEADRRWPALSVPFGSAKFGFAAEIRLGDEVNQFGLAVQMLSSMSALIKELELLECVCKDSARGHQCVYLLSHPRR